MWNAEAQMFVDCDWRTLAPSPRKAAVGFYPFMSDLAGAEHLVALHEQLLNPEAFWTKWPVPTSPQDDPEFDAEGRWRGVRHACPWNGRVWPMTNSHIADALGTAAVRFGDAGLRRRTAELISKTLHMMAFDGDPSRPNSFEHYHPMNGSPSQYRGIDDYQHSWIVDLIIQYVCGVRPDEFSLTIDPFPFGLKRISLKNLHVKGRRIDFDLRGKKFSVMVDGKRSAEGTLGRPVTIQI
jgi:hypothetical protein